MISGCLPGFHFSRCCSMVSFSADLETMDASCTETIYLLGLLYLAFYEVFLDYLGLFLAQPLTQTLIKSLLKTSLFFLTIWVQTQSKRLAIVTAPIY